MFKKEVQPLPQNMADAIGKSINRLQGIPETKEVEAKPQPQAQEIKESVEELEESSCGTMNASYKPKAKKEELDPVNPKAVKKKFDDRKDKDIDNDGEVDSSDEYLHKRRKAISKALESKKHNASIAEAKRWVLEPGEYATKNRGYGGEYYKLNAKDADTLNKYFAKASDKDKGNVWRMFWNTDQKKAIEIARKGIKESVTEEVEQVEEAYKTPAEAKAYEAGKKAWRDKKKYDTNPNKKGTPEHTAWSKGHNDARAKFVKKYGSNEEKMRYEEVELDEAKSDYTIYHKTFSSAVQHAVEVAKKRGFEVDEDEYDRKVALGPRKPSKGKTNSYSISLTKGGKSVKQKLHMQVYYDEGRYELNMYIS